MTTSSSEVDSRSRPRLISLEYDLAGMLPVNDHHVYYAGAGSRTPWQIRASIQMHKEYLRQLVRRVRRDNRDREFKFDIELALAPSGEVASCRGDFYSEFCAELGKIDFGIVDADAPQRLVIEIGKYGWQPRIEEPGAN